MKNKDVVAALMAYHPELPGYAGCDDYKCGDPEAACTGVVTAMTATIEVIRQTAALGCNLLIVHEPTFYTTPDFPDWRGGFANTVYDEKRKLLDELGITVWRDHDHMHVHEPDCIFDGVIDALGWKPYLQDSPGEAMFVFDLPGVCVGELEDFLIQTLHLNGTRRIGDRETVVRKVAIVGHLFPDAHGGSHVRADGTYHEYGTAVIRAMEAGVDCIIPGELVEWTTLSYIRDAIQLGRTKAMISIGHFSVEELGMRALATTMRGLLPEAIPVHYVPSGDMYQYTKAR